MTDATQTTERKKRPRAPKAEPDAPMTARLTDGLEIERDALLRLLQPARRLVETKVTMPILANVLVRAGGGVLRVAATDLVVSAAARLDAVPGSFEMALPYRRLLDLVQSLPAGAISVEADGPLCAVVRAGKSRHRIPGMPAADFPTLPDPAGNGAALEAAPLVAAAEFVLASASTDETRPHLSGVKLEQEGKTLRAISTDGHRLSVAEWEAKSDFILDALLPRKAVELLVQLARGCDDSIYLSVDEANAYVDRVVGGERVVVSCKLVDARFPPWRQVVPAERDSDLVATVSREPLVAAVERASQASASRSLGLILSLEEGQIRLDSETAEKGAAAEEVEAECAGNRRVGLSARYLVDACGPDSWEQVSIRIGGELDPVVVRGVGSSWFAVVMPMRI